jgi:CheY-like chemotaxis protein
MLTILIIDDSEADQYLTKHVIEEFDPNATILQAYDGREALDILGALPAQPDAIFLDINMPRMNGYDFLAEYQMWEERSIVVIMLTSSDQILDREKASAYESVIEYFTKPVTVSDLEKIPQLAEKR